MKDNPLYILSFRETKDGKDFLELGEFPVLPWVKADS